MKTQHKSILVIAVLFLSVADINSGYAHERAAGNTAGLREIKSLSPVIPVEADFNYCDINMHFDIQSLSPVVPVEADFNDDGINLVSEVRTLAPTAPAEADFSDSL